MRQGAASIRQRVANWKHPIGTTVRYRRDDGTFVESRTRSAPAMLSAWTAVIWLEGHGACVDFDRVEVIP